MVRLLTLGSLPGATPGRVVSLPHLGLDQVLLGPERRDVLSERRRALLPGLLAELRGMPQERLREAAAVATIPMEGTQSSDMQLDHRSEHQLDHSPGLHGEVDAGQRVLTA
jgi:hypothetical protein